MSFKKWSQAQNVGAMDDSDAKAKTAPAAIPPATQPDELPVQTPQEPPASKA